jgi:pyruvate/2-oxoglutarate/acetoin dehydrogenase E1 component
MRADKRVVVLGVDVGLSGGVYGVTGGLYDEFGMRRVIDTPIAEAGVLGAAVGAAMAGVRPVAEIMYMDFLTVCLDPIVNQAAKLRYMTGGALTVPIVFRTQTGGGRSAGAQHSQSLEGILAHVPGLHVYCPGDARDAHDLLIDAIRHDGPVCFVENRRLYGKRCPDWDRPRLPAGRARVLRPGDDLTVVTWGRMVAETQRAVDELQGELSVELIDLRTLVPLDSETLIASVQRTGRCLVVHEAVTRYGPGAELLARIAEDALFDLDGPIRRYGALPAPTPYSPELESAALPGAAGIAQQIRDVAHG